MKKLIPLFFLSIALFISACSGGSEKKEGETADSTQATEARTIDIYGLNQFKFAVKEVTDGIRTSDTLTVDGETYYRLEEIMAEPGEEIEINLTTVSQMPPTAMSHNWLLLDQGTDVQAFAMASLKAKDNDYVAPDMSEQLLAQTGLVAGGNTDSVTFTAPETAGEYEYICTFPGHFSGGMRGILTVSDSSDAAM